MEILKFLRVQWDRSTAVIAAVLGALALLGGYLGASNTPFVAAQLPYFISGGLVGMFFLGIAATAWISADLHDEWRELNSLRGLVEEDMASRGVRRGDGPKSAERLNVVRQVAPTAPQDVTADGAGRPAADGARR